MKKLTHEDTLRLVADNMENVLPPGTNLVMMVDGDSLIWMEHYSLDNILTDFELYEYFYDDKGEK